MAVTVCMRCVLRAAVNFEPSPGPFNETPEEHLARMHPNRDANLRECAELEGKLARRIAFAENAKNN